jgi:hypothetical protein
MASGTPVLATRQGAVPEVVTDGETGFIRNTVSELTAAAQRIPELDRRACRRRVAARFSAAAMADGYEAVYRGLVARRPLPVLATPGPWIAGWASGHRPVPLSAGPAIPLAYGLTEG